MALCCAFGRRSPLFSLVPILLLISAQFVSGMDFVDDWEFPSDRLDAFQKRRARELFGKRSAPPAVANYERHSRRTRELFGKRAAAEPFTEAVEVPLMALALPEEDEQYNQRAAVVPSRTVLAQLRKMQRKRTTANEMEEGEEAPSPFGTTGGLWLLQRHRRGVHRELFG